MSTGNRARTAGAPLTAVLAADVDFEGVRREFFPDGRHEVLLLLDIGRPGPDAWRDRLPRLSTEEVVRTL